MTVSRQGRIWALVAGQAEAETALPPAELRETLGYGAYETAAKPYVLPG